MANLHFYAQDPQCSFTFWGLWGSVSDVVVKYRLKSKGGIDEKVDTNDKSVFIQLNGLSSGYKVTQSFLKTTLQSMYDFAYLFHFRNFTRSETMKRFVTLKIIKKINDNALCLPCFK